MSHHCDDQSDNPPEAMRFFPLAVDLRGKPCLIVGGGAVGTRKVRSLLRAGADVAVVAPAVTDELARLIDSGRLRWLQDSFREEHLGESFLVVAASDDDRLNATVARLAESRGSLVCDASSAERSGVIFGALLETGDATLAVFTDGRSPSQARKTRDRIAELLASEEGPRQE